MNSLYERYQTNRDAETKGIWLNFGPVDPNDPTKGDTRIRLARAGGANEAYQNMRTKLLEPWSASLRIGQPIPEADSRKIMTRLYAATIITEWENVFDADGNQRPCTLEQKEQVLTDLPQLYAEIFDFVNNYKHYLESIREATAKN